MSDVLSPDQRHRNMAAIHSASTKPELKLRQALWRLGFRYKINDKKLPGKPDLVLPKYRTLIFVHGCFWHGHNGCPTSHIPETNADYWTSKITRNQERDQETWRQLEAKGWFVIVVWECELKKAQFQDTLARVEAQIISNGEALRATREERQKAREEYRKERLLQKEREAALKAELQERFHKR